MPDIVSSEKRSQMMAGIKGKNTRPELLIRSLLHKSGLRYKLHENTLPGKPDMVFPKYRAAIFIHGCFWHGHDCHLFKIPSTNREFWLTKINGNRERDQRDIEKLTALGWRIMIIWECAVKGKTRLEPQKIAETCRNWLLSPHSGNLIIQGI